MSTTAYKIEVMQWHEDGNHIEFYDERFGWQKVSDPLWDWSNTQYRKKPKPIECWVTILDGATASTVHMSKEDADSVLDSPNYWERWSVRKVVIE